MSEIQENYQAVNSLPVINFSYNWNKKLDCTAFTTIRVKNESKFYVGRDYQIHLVDKFVKNATIKAIQYFHIKSLNEFMSYVDTGYSLAETTKVLERMYGKKIFAPDFLFCIILLVTKKP